MTRPLSNRQQIIDMSRTPPRPRRSYCRRIRHRRIEAVKVPVQPTKAARNNGLLPLTPCTTDMTQYRIALLVRQAEEVHIAHLLDPRSRWKFLLVLALWAGGHTLEILSEVLWQLKGARILIFEKCDQGSKDATVLRDTYATCGAVITKPFIRKIVWIEGWVDTSVVKGAGAAVATH